MAQFGFIPIIKNITRPVSNTCIDHIFIKIKFFANIKPIIIQSNITVHYPIMIYIDNNLLDNCNNKPSPLKIFRADKLKLTSLIQNHEWSEIYKIIDINTVTHYFIVTLTSLKKRPHLKYLLILKLRN